MPIFDCSECGCAENTAMAPWYGLDNDVRCTECKTGEWHKEFDRFVRIECPDCGPVSVSPDLFNHGRAISGISPKCNYRLHFEP